MSIIGIWIELPVDALCGIIARFPVADTIAEKTNAFGLTLINASSILISINYWGSEMI
jgi:hypothetical protein